MRQWLGTITKASTTVMNQVVTQFTLCTISMFAIMGSDKGVSLAIGLL